MATALDIIKAALEDINVLAAGETPSAADVSDSLKRLNRILAEYQVKGCDEINPQLAGTRAVLTLADGYHQALIDVLAKALCPVFGKVASPALERDAGSGDRLLWRGFRTATVFGVDTALQTSRMSGTRNSWDGVA